MRMHATTSVVAQATWAGESFHGSTRDPEARLSPPGQWDTSAMRRLVDVSPPSPRGLPLFHYFKPIPSRRMSRELETLAWRTSIDQTSSLKFVLVSLCDHADDDGWGVYPSIAYTALRVDLSERTVQRALRHLERIGLLVKVRDACAYPPMPAEWRINVTRLRDLARENAPVWLQLKERQKKRGDTMSPPGLFDGAKDVDKCRKRGDTVSRGGDTKRTKGATPCHPNLKSESLDRTGKKKKENVDNSLKRPTKQTSEAARKAIDSVNWGYPQRTEEESA